MSVLLRPPSHRGPLIAAGAVVLTAGAVLWLMRHDVDAGWQLLVFGALSALFGRLAVSAPLEGGRPPAYQSVLIVTTLATLGLTLLAFADAFEADVGDLSTGTATCVLALLSLAAGWAARRRNSGIAALICALAGGGALLAATEWILDPGLPAYRWLLLALATTFVLVSLVLRGSRPRHAELLVSAAGLAILAIPANLAAAFFVGFAFPGDRPGLPGFWELVVLAAGFGLIAYAAAERAPGPAYLGVLNLVVFAFADGLDAGGTLRWWPLLLLGTGAAMLLAGLRPARPLPPEPSSYTHEELPLTVRVED